MAQLNSGPGVYIDEVPSGVHTTTGVATSIAAFAVLKTQLWRFSPSLRKPSPRKAWDLRVAHRMHS
jgi:hypothetical protein